MSEQNFPTCRIQGTIGGDTVHCFTLTNAQGMRVEVSEWGAHLVSVQIPNEDGSRTEVTLGYDNLEGWTNNEPYFSSTCGRFANRIAHGTFVLDGKEYTLATNNAPGGIPCHLHGGVAGFSHRIWKGESFSVPGEQGVRLHLVSPDGEEGYPGTLEVTLTVRLLDGNEIDWSVEATTDQATPVNIVNHSYWNLSGDHSVPVTDHQLLLHADQFLPTDAGLIPTGERRPVEGSPMDFTRLRRIGDAIAADDEAIRYGAGYDHCWVIRGEPGTVRPAAVVVDPVSGRRMEILTDAPGLQFYAANFLDGTVKGRGGLGYGKHAGLCLETEGFPDAPNQPGFPSCILRPGETYRHTMVVRFQGA